MRLSCTRLCSDDKATSAERPYIGVCVYVWMSVSACIYTITVDHCI